MKIMKMNSWRKMRATQHHAAFSRSLGYKIAVQHVDECRGCATERQDSYCDNRCGRKCGNIDMPGTDRTGSRKRAVAGLGRKRSGCVCTDQQNQAAE